MALQLESAVREVREAQEAVRARETALEAAHKAAAEKKRAAEEEADTLARERVKRQRLEDEVKVCAEAGSATFRQFSVRHSCQCCHHLYSWYCRVSKRQLPWPLPLSSAVK
jgi:hypothetical protein